MKPYRPTTREFFFPLHQYLFLLFISIGPPLPAHAQISADHWLGGAVRVGPSITACDSLATGSIRFDSAALNLKFCDGTAWRAIGTATTSGDTTPNIFTFTDLTDQPLGTLIVSNTVTITGMDPDQVASVTGSGTPQISVNGGSWVSSTLISSGDTITVRMVSSLSASTARTATVTIGSLSDNWDVTTRAGQTSIFLTPNNYSGNIGGLAVADTICQTAANAAGKPGAYKAVLSTSTQDVKARLTVAHPVVRVSDSAIIAATNLWTQSFASDLRTVGGDVQYGAAFWTGTTTGGTKHADTCSDWTSDSGNGKTGDPSSGYTFTGGGSDSCANPKKFLCLQQ